MLFEFGEGLAHQIGLFRGHQKLWMPMRLEPSDFGRMASTGRRFHNRSMTATTPRKKILVIEDQPAMRRNAALLLEMDFGSLVAKATPTSGRSSG